MEPVRVETNWRPNLTQTLKDMRVGDTLRFAPGTNYGSLRTIATSVGIKIIVRALHDGQIEVTRKC